jgi:hypothetical protein
MRSSSHLAQGLIEQCSLERARLVEQLQSYEPFGVVRLWQGRSTDSLSEVTDELVDTLRRALAMIDATIEFAAAIGNAL